MRYFSTLEKDKPQEKRIIFHPSSEITSSLLLLLHRTNKEKRRIIFREIIGEFGFMMINLIKKFIGSIDESHIPVQVSRSSVGDIYSEIESILEYVEKNGNCEFIRLLEQCSKMDAADMRKFLEYAEKL
jgi:hypothetical protein